MKISDLMMERSSLYKRIFSLKIALALAGVIIAGILYKEGGKEVNNTQNNYIGLIKIDFEIFDDYKFDKILEEAAKDSTMKALVVDINSPGGTTGASEKIYHKLKQIKTRVPIVASIGTIGTSGAYMVALAADKIYALNTTITGSIGVIVQMTELVEIAKKLGIKFRSYKSSPLKATPNPMEAATAESDAAIMSLITDSHQYFIDLVMKNRQIPLKEAVKLADGRIFTGRQAISNKLVDEIGTVDDAVKWLIDEKKIASNLEVIELKPKKLNGFYDMIIDKLEEESRSFVSMFLSKLTIR